MIYKQQDAHAKPQPSSLRNNHNHDHKLKGKV